ncbi:MAG: hypothetical protein V2J16_12620 [Thermoleophilia bacterium]|nr:hypothetical protein [Thermoleophilia bacterium]
MSRRRDDRGPVPAIVLLAALGLALAGLAPTLAGCGGGDATPGAGASSPAASFEPGASPDPVTTAAGDPLPPGTQAVYLLGGSSARECVESNAAWGAAIRAAGGPAVLAVDLGATNQSFSADRRLVQGMPKGSVVLIGVSLGRYTSPPPRALGDKPLTAEGRAALAGEVEIRHRYSEKRIQTDERKGEILDLWLAERYDLYRRNYEANHEELERLVGACRDRGLRFALLELPVNLEFVGDRLDDPRAMYREDCRRLAAVNGVPFLGFVEEVGLRNTEFYDLMHLVEPGREKWQARLAEEGVALLDADR